MERNRICIAILALGGQGGGVLAEWIQSLARGQNWLAQGTSVPGVAQRTGSTVYYVELAERASPPPIMAQMPVPGDVDIVIASELMEAGRALLRGFATPERTILIGSTHRIYAIAEKSAMGDGRGESSAVIEAARQAAKRFIGFDMEAATFRSGSVISSVMFGALAASGALPFPRAAFEDAICASGIAVEGNLRGFDAGFRAALPGLTLPEDPRPEPPEPTTDCGRRLRQWIIQRLPEPAWHNALHGVQRLMDYQDSAYAELYLTRLEGLAAKDRAPFEVSTEAARYLALWMSYEDVIRVADLKIRASRFQRVGSEVNLDASNLLGVTEFMHPRLQEIRDILPPSWGRWLARLPIERFFQQGRHVETTSLRWFVILRALAGLRRFRPKSSRFAEEQARIEAWLCDVAAKLPDDYALALELLHCQRLVKGYGDTFERGWRNFQRVMTAAKSLSDGDAAMRVRRLRDAALADDQGLALSKALS
jgi:indolepyruvate ferredoxin oxidoreductase beta subunit